MKFFMSRCNFFGTEVESTAQQGLVKFVKQKFFCISDFRKQLNSQRKAVTQFHDLTQGNVVPIAMKIRIEELQAVIQGKKRNRNFRKRAESGTPAGNQYTAVQIFADGGFP